VKAPIRRRTKQRHPEDFHRTPIEAVRALLVIEASRLPRFLWEPACGDGAIVLPLREAGYTVVASDLVDRGCPFAKSGLDFLAERMPAYGIVTNPPYSLAQAFCAKALELSPYVAMLLPLGFLAGQRRMPWHRGSPLARVHIFSRRLPLMHREGYDGPKATSGVDHAWFVWDEERRVPHPRVMWVDYDDL
jgi:hypothetical protein